MSALKPQYAGLRHWYRNPLTGSHVGLYDGEPGGFDTEGGRWQTVCEEHGSICSHGTLGVARAFARIPEEWCEDCMEIAEKFECAKCGDGTALAAGQACAFCGGDPE